MVLGSDAQDVLQMVLAASDTVMCVVDAELRCTTVCLAAGDGMGRSRLIVAPPTLMSPPLILPVGTPLAVVTSPDTVTDTLVAVNSVANAARGKSPPLPARLYVVLSPDVVTAPVVENVAYADFKPVYTASLAARVDVLAVVSTVRVAPVSLRPSRLRLRATASRRAIAVQS